MNHEKIIVELELDDILPNRFQPRFKFPEQAITELAESIKEHGVIQPILVRRLGDKYEIIAGERRYKASLLAGKRTIPAIIAELNDKDSAEVALIENVQRQDLTPIEEAVSYRKILDMGYLTQEQLAEKLGKTQSTISNKLRLLNLDDEVQEALLDEKISERHARSLLKIDSKQKQKEILEKIIQERLTVKKTDDLINKILLGENEIQSNLNTTEIPSIFMNNSIQVEDSAIQSSSAIEFINPNDQVMNSFTNNNTRDNDLLDFLNIDNNVEPIKTVPVEEIEEVPIIENFDFNQSAINNQKQNEMQEFNQFSIPTSPIIEEIDDNPIQVLQVDNNEQELKEINDMINKIPTAVNPGFVDVENIEKNAKDIYVEKPLADIDNLLMSENENNTEIVNFDQLNNESEQNLDDSIQQNKFFTMFAPVENINEEQKEENHDEETFNFIPPIETDKSLNQFLNADVEESNLLNQEISTPEAVIDNSQYDNNDQFSFSKIDEQPNLISNENNNINQPEYDFQDNIEEIEDSPKILNYPEDNIIAESVRKEEVIETKNVENNITSAVDLKTVINTIRNCADTIEKYGFALECEEYDFEDMYQVIFKIQKNDKY